MNYDSTNVGVPYIRANNIEIQYSANGIATVTVNQALAVKLADNSVTEIGQIQSISFILDMANNATTPVPLVDPSSGANLGANTTLQQTMLSILAVIRQHQIAQNI